MAYRKAAGRPIKVPSSAVTARDMIRRHLHTRGLHMSDTLPVWWGMHLRSAYRLIWKKHGSLSPGHIDAVIEGLGLDGIDATRLRLAAAREAGWQLEPRYLQLILRADGL